VLSAQSLGIVETSSVECPDYYALKFLGVRNEDCCSFNNLELDSLSESSYHAPSVRGAIVPSYSVVLDYGQLVAWSVVSGGM
jgi:hypothetical protein